jgi:hypothetical protein
MQINRREFTGHLVKGAAVVAIGSEGFLLTGCAGFTVQSVLDWVKIASGSIGGVINLLIGAGILACATCSVLANVALAAITAVGTAVQNYLNAPAADKATLKGKIITALHAAFAAAASSFQSVQVIPGNILTLVTGLAGLVIDAIAGFITALGGTALKSFSLAANSIPVTPHIYAKASDFRDDCNKLFVQYRHPEEVLH